MALVAALLMLATFYVYFDRSLTARTEPNRVLNVTPGGELVLKRGPGGHYVFPGKINGQPVSFLLDTGATLVSVPAHLAEDLGLEAGAYHRSETANGTIETRAARIDTLSFGPFALRDVQGSLVPGLGGEKVLLGMSALRHLEFTQRGDTLVMRPLGR
jgi:aspartyl protease family protein